MYMYRMIILILHTVNVLHTDINISPMITKIMLHVEIIYLACTGLKYATTDSKKYFNDVKRNN